MPVLVPFASLGGIAASGLRPRPGQPVLAVFPAWWDAPRSFGAAAAAGALVLRTGAWPALLVVGRADQKPPLNGDLPDRLRAAGA